MKKLSPWAGLALSVTMVLAFWLVFRQAGMRRIHDRFEAETALMRVRVADRMAAHEQILRGAAGFIAQRQGLPTRQEWHHFAETLDLDRNNPGVQAFGFAQWIPSGDLAAHVRRLRAEGFAGYEVRPGGPLPPDGGVSSIIYTEPFDLRNQRTFGLDMLTETTRREAMVWARDTGRMSLSGRVKLIQEDTAQVQAGTVLYVPVYRRGWPTGTVEERRAGLLGWAYLACRMQTLLEGTLGQATPGIYLELFDGFSENERDVLYSHTSGQTSAVPPWVDRAHFAVAGKVWTLRSAPGPLLLKYQRDDAGEIGILALGLLFSGAIFALLRSFARAERRAIAERERSEADLRLSQERLSLALTSSDLGTFAWDIPRNIRHFDATVLRLIGIEPRGFTGAEAEFYAAIHPDDRAFVRASLTRAMADGHYATEYRARWSDGSIHHIEARGRLFLDAQGRPARLNGVLWDITPQKLAEQALQRERTFTRALLDNLAEGVVACDERGGLVLFNRTAREWYGAEALDLPPDQWAQRYGLYEPDGVTPVDAQSTGLLRALRGEEVPRGRLTTIRVDGQPLRYVLTSASAIRDGAGRVLGAVSVQHDITRQRQTEEAVRRISVAVDQSPVTVVITDLEGRIEYVNPKFTQMTGYTVEEALGQNPRILKSGHFPPEVYREMWASISTGATWKGEFHNRTKNGDLFWESATIAPIRDSAGAITSFVAIKEDITEFKRIEEARIQSETRLRELFETSDDGIVMVDLEGRYQDCNQAFLELLGLDSRQELISRSYEEFTPEEYLEGERRVIADLGRSSHGRGQHYIKEYRRKTGDRVQVELRIWARRDPEGRTVGLWALVRDITERTRAEREKQGLQARLQQARRMESLGILAAGVAHNINNVLAIILGTASLRGQAASDPEDLEAYRTIDKVCLRGREVVKSLMQFGQSSLSDRAPFELHLMIREVRALLANTTRNTIRMVEAFTGEAVWIEGDSAGINHALLNLSLNALDAMPDGGTLTFRTTLPEPGWVELSVEDTGRGMTAEVLAHVMEPFYTTKGVGEGTGLGLSMTYGVVKAHGGTLELSSQPGQGTVARIRVPRGSAPAEPSAPAQAAPAMDLAAMKVLLVDDDPDVQYLMARMLRKAGVAQVQTVSSGQEALDSLRPGELPSLVILDQNMPGLSGTQTMERIRTRHPGLPILISSGQPGLEEWAEFRQPGVDVISKPFTLGEIQDKLKRFRGVAGS